MEARLADLAQLVRGELIGDGEVLIRGTATLNDVGPGELTFIDQPGGVEELLSNQAAAALVPCGVECEGLPIIRVDDVHKAFASIVMHFRPPREHHSIGKSADALISPTARLAADVEVHAGASIGEDVEIGRGSIIHAGVRIMPGCRLEENVTVFPNAVLYEDTHVGSRTLIHAGAVIGAYGFGYTPVNGRHQRSPQLGNVEIGADVEIGACSTIDRGTYGPTTIGEGTKIDNLVIVAHNCRIGRHNLLCSQVGIAGSTTTGDYVVMAGQVGVRDHVHIGTGTTLGAKSGVSNDVPEGMFMLGIPATPLREQKLKQGALSKLPGMRRQLKALQATIDKLQHQDPTQRKAVA